MLLALAALGATGLGASSNATLCIACTLVLTLAEERALDAGQDGSSAICALLDAQRASAAQQPALSPCAAGAVLPSPDELCKELDLCDGTCALFPGGLWPPPHVAASTAGGDTMHARRIGEGGSPSSSSGDELARLLAADDPMAALRRAVVAAAQRLPSAMLLQPPEAVARAATAASVDAAVLSGGGGVAAAPKIPDPCGLNITCLVNRIGNLHLPLLDDDGDAFAPTGQGDDSLVARRARGSHWRGADCNDLDAVVYPGRRAGADLLEDTNCNGIHGGGEGIPSYEEKWCAHSSPRGVIALGDSATAHFHIPPALFSADNFSLEELPVRFNCYCYCYCYSYSYSCFSYPLVTILLPPPPPPPPPHALLRAVYGVLLHRL